MAGINLRFQQIFEHAGHIYVFAWKDSHFGYWQIDEGKDDIFVDMHFDNGDPNLYRSEGFVYTDGGNLYVAVVAVNDMYEPFYSRFRLYKNFALERDNDDFNLPDIYMRIFNTYAFDNQRSWVLIHENLSNFTTQGIDYNYTYDLYLENPGTFLVNYSHFFIQGNLK